MASVVKVAEVEPDVLPIEERVRRRAHELWLNLGDKPGSAHEDWLSAEQEILSERTAIVDDE